MTNQNKYARKLLDALTATPVLSDAEAIEQLPDLVMAELAMEEVEEPFKDVLDALYFYPEVADRYELLKSEMSLLIDAPAGPAFHAVPAPPQFRPIVLDLARGVRLRRLRADAAAFVMHLFELAKPARVQAAHLSESAVKPFSGRLEMIAGQPTVAIELLPTEDDRWQLEVFLRARSAERWTVSAFFKGRELRVVASSSARMRFEPLDEFPAEGLTVACVPEQAAPRSD